MYQHVAAAVIFNQRGEVLLALRPAHKHQGGLWEFPGGKVEAAENVLEALKRELHEELGITIMRARPLIRIPHHYPDKSVLLDVWRVDAFHGEPHPKEGQRIEWVAQDKLAQREYPAANLPILNAVRLPVLYLVTGEPEPGWSDKAFLDRLERCLQGGARLIQLRAKTLDQDRYRTLAEQALGLCAPYGAQLLLNAAPRLAQEIGAHGVHLTSARLLELERRPLDAGHWVAASCHNRAELEHAMRIKADFAVAAPVLDTPTHPGAATLGWQGLQNLTELATLPVYALGGMQAEHLALAFRHGAQGIAVVSAIWNTPRPEEATARILRENTAHE
ncbi:MAG: Nudix family hydrolase [Gammaproteobacteria bacterium]|nr:Nudix family hydrolase [Gammaproteobacteria bacterium]